MSGQTSYHQLAVLISGKLGLSSEKIFYIDLKIFASKQKPISNNSEIFDLDCNLSINILYLPSALPEMIFLNPPNPGVFLRQHWTSWVLLLV